MVAPRFPARLVVSGLLTFRRSIDNEWLLFDPGAPGLFWSFFVYNVVSNRKDERTIKKEHQNDSQIEALRNCCGRDCSCQCLCTIVTATPIQWRRAAVDAGRRASKGYC